eukprot:403369921
MFCNKSHSEQVKRLDSISYLYLLTGLSTNIIWFAYGYQVQNQDIVLNNIFGMMLSLILLSLYMGIMRSRDEIVILYCFLPFFMAFLISSVPVNICGLLGSVFSITSNLTPLEKIRDVIYSHDPRFINLTISSFTCFNAFMWCIYGFLSSDVFVFTSQLINFNAGMIQILFYLWASKKISDSNIIMRALIKLFKLTWVDVKTFSSKQYENIKQTIQGLREKLNLENAKKISITELLSVPVKLLQSLQSYNLKEYLQKIVSQQKQQEKQEDSSYVQNIQDYMDVENYTPILQQINRRDDDDDCVSLKSMIRSQNYSTLLQENEPQDNITQDEIRYTFDNNNDLLEQQSIKFCKSSNKQLKCKTNKFETDTRLREQDSFLILSDHDIEVNIIN